MLDVRSSFTMATPRQVFDVHIFSSVSRDLRVSSDLSGRSSKSEA